MKSNYIRAVVFICISILIIEPIYSINKEIDSVAVTINRYKRMSSQELFDMGESFFSKNIKDSAAICYSLICQRKIDKNDTISAQIVCKAYNKWSTIYFYNCDFQSTLELLFKALNLCEDIQYYNYIGRIYNNIGNVHFAFKEMEVAKKYYKTASKYYGGDDLKASITNNLGAIAYHENKLDTALSLFMEAMKIRIRTNNESLYDQFLNIGLINQALNKKDTSLLYYRKALLNSIKLDKKEKIAKCLSSIGQLHLDIGNIDSATYYLSQSNTIAQKYKLFDILSENLLHLSSIEEMKGNIRNSLKYYKRHSIINDSLFNASKYGNINELQFLYDMAKIDKKIEALNVEQEIKDSTIKTQIKVQIIMAISLLIISISFIMLYMKNKKLNLAYGKLFSQNVEIVNSDKQSKQLKEELTEQLKEKDRIINTIKNESENNIDVLSDVNESVKYKNSSLSNDSKSEIASLIIEIMECKEIFCDPNFSLAKLSEMVNSNANYVSQIVNDTFKKNFRSFLNEYRIKEARELLSDPNSRKYSIEAISTMVGFKSKSTFNIAFKEVTGITPSFYAKSMSNNAKR